MALPSYLQTKDFNPYVPFTTDASGRKRNISSTPSIQTEIENLLKNVNRSTRPSYVGNPVETAKTQGLLFKDIYTPPETGVAEDYFKDYLDVIGAPSSVEDVQKQIESQAVQQLIDEISSDEQSALAANRLEFLDRGFGGPGQLSELETAGAAGIRGSFGKTKANARTQAVLAEIERAKAREAAKTAALGERYKVGAQKDIAAQDIAARGALSDTGTLSSLLSEQFRGGITTGEGAKNREVDYLNLFLDTSLKGAELSQKDRQFLEQLGLDRELGYLDANTRKYIKNRDRGNYGDDLLSGFISGFGGKAGGNIADLLV